MGCHFSKLTNKILPGNGGEDYKITHKIEEEMQLAHNRDMDKIKVILLGAGESGKSTLIRQFRILFGIPLSDAKRKKVDHRVYAHIISGMKILIEKTEDEKLKEITNQNFLEKIDLTDDNAIVDMEFGKAAKSIWDEPCIQKTWSRRSDFQIFDCVKYFMNDIDRIMKPNYIPSQEDILHIRLQTNGIAIERYNIDDVLFEMYDVGGQRNERRKWIHCFDNVNCVIFLTAINEYDQGLYEDQEKNRLIESIELFNEVCNNKVFQNSSMILFLNKRDLFEEKIQRKDIKSVRHFSDFTGGLGDGELGIKYFLGKFLETNKTKRKIYSHVTCATNTENINVVFGVCKRQIILDRMKNAGMIVL